MIIDCPSCHQQTDDAQKLCLFCGKPLQATVVAALAPILMPLSPLGASGGMVGGVNHLVPLTFNGDEDPGRAIDLGTAIKPSNGSGQATIGWFVMTKSAINTVDIDLARLFADYLVERGVGPNGADMVAVSRRTGALRRDDAGNIFLSADLEASSVMWIVTPGQDARLVLPGDEVLLKVGDYIFLGKNSSGITFVAR